jgi:hypothetical protein
MPTGPPAEVQSRKLPTLEDWDNGLEELRRMEDRLSFRKRGAVSTLSAYDTGRLRFFLANGIDYTDPTNPMVADFYAERRSMMAEWADEFAVTLSQMADIGGVMLLCPVRYHQHISMGDIMERASARVRYITLTNVQGMVLHRFGPKRGPTQ